MNDVSANPMFLDTPIAYVPGGGNLQAAVVWQSNVKVNHFEFAGYANATDVALVKDRNGKTVCRLTGTTDKQEVRSSKVGWVEGLVLDTLTAGGSVLVYLE